ncbi:hypothetical protein ATO6_04370 [Oceanicola sp. 22II-s10i]|uniref:glutathione S-transferase family protein n=1 Tax=Oceanicola sp. 22II-s10i TaxID=1317116 RepID=UPI000B520EA7|nr:glutathione S-transferase family protein [Oceanicola sp. 22II-s10i]OWU86100.1 hypothetical protein ATO6_04370 [Oceanicola sp. 22II-s10i]
MSGLTLHGFRYSVYVRAARIALHERGLDYALIEVNPFSGANDPPNPHPMNRIPVLNHDGFRLFETLAILDYIASFPGPALIPDDPKRRARMWQVQGIVNSYAYWPLVRQVYVAGAWDRAVGRTVDQAELDAGLTAAGPVLAMLEDIATEGLALSGPVTLADIQLAPMIAAFATAPEGAGMLARHPVLSRWWQAMAERPSVTTTDAGLPVDSTEG